MLNCCFDAHCGRRLAFHMKTHALPPSVFKSACMSLRQGVPYTSYDASAATVHKDVVWFRRRRGLRRARLDLSGTPLLFLGAARRSHNGTGELSCVRLLAWVCRHPDVGGALVMLDLHRLGASDPNHNKLWYTASTPPARVKDVWVLLARRYCGRRDATLPCVCDLPTLHRGVSH